MGTTPWIILAATPGKADKAHQVGGGFCWKGRHRAMATERNSRIAYQICKSELSCNSSTPTRCSQKTTFAHLFRKHDVGRFSHSRSRSNGTVNLGYYRGSRTFLIIHMAIRSNHSKSQEFVLVLHGA